MAVLRQKGCYKTKARIFRDDPREVTIRWFIVPDGTPFLPVPHLWGGRPWRYDRTPPTIGPGELLQSPLVWDEGLPPAQPSDWIGADDWWANGIPIAALGGPVPLRRPGVCKTNKQAACGTGCDVCPLISPVWTMEYFDPVAGITPATLVKEPGCLFTSSCLKGLPQCPAGTARAWLVQVIEPISVLTEQVITNQQGSVFSSCCPTEM